MGNAPNGGPRPTAEGTLANRPLSHLLLYVRMNRLTGKFMLQAPDGTGGALALWRGQIVAARTMPPSAHFGAVALSMGLSDAPTLEATYRQALAMKRLHGEMLIAHGKLTPAQRDQILAEQTCRKAYRLFALPSTTVFAFYEERPGAAEPPVQVDPTEPLWRAVRDNTCRDDRRSIVAPFVGKPLRLVNESPIARAGLSRDELAITEALVKRPMTIGQVRTTFASATPERIEQLFYLLLLTKSAEPAAVVPEASPVSAPIRRTGSLDADAIEEALRATRRSVPPPSLQPPTSGRVSGSVAPPPISVAPSARAPSGAPTGPSALGMAGIQRRAQTVEDEDPFVTLGLAPNAPVDAARTAYLQLVKLWHPDRLGAELAPVRAEVMKIFAQMTKAHQTLTDAEARRTFLAARAEQEALSHRPRKEVLRLIDAALAKKDLAFAADESHKMVMADPRDHDAHAIMAWVAAFAGEGPEPAVRSAVTALDRVIASDDECLRALYYRAVLHKRLGNGPLAHKDFLRVVKLDPKHVDAGREVRLYEMRKR